MKTVEILIIGAGVFGATAALELRRRGHEVALLDEGTVPHPLAASTDISKVIRMEYGTDEQYMALAEEAISGFREWNAEFKEPLFHETGVVMLTRRPMVAGGFEYEGYSTLLKRGHSPTRLDADEIARRFPAWKPGAYIDGFFHAVGGYGESGKIVATVRRVAESEGVSMVDGRASGLKVGTGKVDGLHLESGDFISCDHVVVAAGAWTPLLVPELATEMRASGHPVFHLAVRDPHLFSPPRFLPFLADVSRTGWYGFPFHPAERVVKIANHGEGLTLHPETDDRVVSSSDEEQLRVFLETTFPALVDAPIVYTRRCLYTDTRDEHFLIDRHPSIEGLSVATGGSGHGFKFAPILGGLVADAVEGRSNPRLDRFRWRILPPETEGEEAARFRG